MLTIPKNWKVFSVAAIGVQLVILLLYIMWQEKTVPIKPVSDTGSTFISRAKWGGCLPPGVSRNLSHLSDMVKNWRTENASCRMAADVFNRIFYIKVKQRHLTVKLEQFKEKVMHWLGGDAELYKQFLNQTVISVYNRYSQEDTAFNPLRARRPAPYSNVPQLQLIEEMHEKTKENCDFCRAEQFTAQESDKRLKSSLSMTATNAFPLAAKNELIILHSHHPLNWTKEEFVDMFHLTDRWLAVENSKDESYRFPAIYWDHLTPAGASQIHLHLQAVLLQHHFPGPRESLAATVENYRKDFSADYLSDLIGVHESLGLTVRFKSAIAIATLTPKKENEIMIIAEKMNDDFILLMYSVVRAYFEDMELFSLSMATYLPAYPARDAEDRKSASLPAICHIVTRNKIPFIRNDVGSLELFMFSSVNFDPFELIGIIRQSVEKRLQS